MHQLSLWITLAFVSLPTATLVTSVTTTPSTRPAVTPPKDAPTLSERLGQITALTFRYHDQRGEEVEYWDVVLADRTVLARVEAMRRSEFGEGDIVLFSHGYFATGHFSDQKLTGMLGWVKQADHPYGLRLRAADGRWGLFIATDEAAKELDRLVRAEALRQRPQHPMIERPR